VRRAGGIYSTGCGGEYHLWLGGERCRAPWDPEVLNRRGRMPSLFFYIPKPPSDQVPTPSMRRRILRGSFPLADASVFSLLVAIFAPPALLPERLLPERDGSIFFCVCGSRHSFGVNMVGVLLKALARERFLCLLLCD